MHLSTNCREHFLDDEWVTFFKQYAPVGARDYGTLRALRKNGIPSYYSGCLTLTLDNPFESRKNIIYAVDLDKKCVNYIKKHADCDVVEIAHTRYYLDELNNEERFQEAQKLLDLYAQARCVITSRLHVTLPCLALKTPVLLIRPDNAKSDRFDGPHLLARHCTPREFLRGQVQFNVNSPPENSDDYLILRKQLLETTSEWIKKVNEGVL